MKKKLHTYTYLMARKADEAKAKRENATNEEDSLKFYNEYQEALKWGPGGQYSQILTAITSAAGSNVSGSIGEMGTNALINYVQGLGAEQAKHLADSFLDKDGNKTAQSESARALLQGLLACGGASAQGGDCGSGALGAAGSVGLSGLLDALLKDSDKLTAEEKLNRENLIGSIIAGIAEGTGNNANDALTGANTEMENNDLQNKQILNNARNKFVAQNCKGLSSSACDKAYSQYIASGLPTALAGLTAPFVIVATPEIVAYCAFNPAVCSSEVLRLLRMLQILGQTH